ncbi:hypothetical protein NTGHW29_140076 [Candidatus Nitrotoga sp. HW29]|uniref:hypothetical protein n=1 Tax=Candidatus Nitrotoga sp. HW29 TaxID=2886963 RepID=UPI001EF170CA|nr:hypothetical protein [Candidatus Nitrotoga sp. HW29]CAH1903701.1 hypothetical protein NTGHW29_140076 [Candidatus Nitrotoga sp. HW29]
MKNAKDYIEETSPNTQKITSFAYWLTSEGLDNPIGAALLRKHITTATDEKFKQMYDGATKAKATLHLEQWELCYMGRWGTPELAKAIVLSDAGRNEALALRAISMAQNTGELPEVFAPMEGIRWAMARGYLINRNICTWCGVAPGTYGHPSNSLSTAGAHHEGGSRDSHNAAPAAAKIETRVGTNKKVWDDARLQALWEESILPGVTQKSLGDKYSISRQRIAALIKTAKNKFSTNNSWLNASLTSQIRTIKGKRY